MENLIAHNGKLLVGNGKAYRYGKVLNETVVLHISASSGTLPMPITVLVKKVEDDSTLHSLSWDGSDLSFLVRDGVQYRIEYGSAGINFVSPPSYTTTAIGDTQRNVDAQYIYFSNGIYIGYTDGSVSPYDQLVSGKIPEGVIVKTDNMSILLHPTEGSPKQWSEDTSIQIAGVTTTTDENTAKADFAGKANTAAVVASGLAGSAFTFATDLGSDWYLPACGELEQIRLNEANINTALGLIGGTQLSFSGHSYLSSTQYSSTQIWYWYRGSYWYHYRKYSYDYCRAVRAFEI